MMLNLKKKNQITKESRKKWVKIIQNLNTQKKKIILSLFLYVYL